VAQVSEADQLARRCAEQMWSDDEASKALGMVLESVGEGVATLSMVVRDDMVNGHDICHGGLIFSLADSTFAFACNSQNQVAVASSCSIDYVSPAYRGDRLTASAAMLHQGKRAGIYDVQVMNQEGRLVAQLRGRSARTGGTLVEPV
jgi:acyl-CoA thioesterase